MTKTTNDFERDVKQMKKDFYLSMVDEQLQKKYMLILAYNGLSISEIASAMESRLQDLQDCEAYHMLTVATLIDNDENANLDNFSLEDLNHMSIMTDSDIDEYEEENEADFSTFYVHVAHVGYTCVSDSEDVYMLLGEWR